MKLCDTCIYQNKSEYEKPCVVYSEKCKLYERKNEMDEKKTSEIMAQIMAGYLCNGCDGCPFYGIEEYEIEQYCDSVPLNCKWMLLWKYFERIEKQEETQEDDLK